MSETDWAKMDVVIQDENGQELHRFRGKRLHGHDHNGSVFKLSTPDQLAAFAAAPGVDKPHPPDEEAARPVALMWWSCSGW